VAKKLEIRGECKMASLRERNGRSIKINTRKKTTMPQEIFEKEAKIRKCQNCWEVETINSLSY